MCVTGANGGLQGQEGKIATSVRFVCVGVGRLTWHPKETIRVNARRLADGGRLAQITKTLLRRRRKGAET